MGINPTGNNNTNPLVPGQQDAPETQQSSPTGHVGGHSVSNQPTGDQGRTGRMTRVMSSVSSFFSGLFGCTRPNWEDRGPSLDQGVRGSYSRLSQRARASVKGTAEKTGEAAAQPLHLEAASDNHEGEEEEALLGAVGGEVEGAVGGEEETPAMDPESITEGLRAAVEIRNEEVQTRAAAIRDRWEHQEQENPSRYQTIGAQTAANLLQHVSVGEGMNALRSGGGVDITDARKLSNGLWEGARDMLDNGNGDAMLVMTALALMGPSLEHEAQVTRLTRDLLREFSDTDDVNEQDEFFLGNLHDLCQQIDDLRAQGDSATLSSLWSHFAEVGQEAVGSLIPAVHPEGMMAFNEDVQWNEEQLRGLQHLSPRVYAQTLFVMLGDVFPE